MTNFTLEALPYGKQDLEPYISEKTLEFHYEKHHKGYLNKLNELVADTPFAHMSLEDVIRKSHGQHHGVFNNAAQVWNHTFFWKSMCQPSQHHQPSDRMQGLINSAFGSVENFNQKFKEAAITQFGSGWAWLVWGGKELSILKTGNAETSLTHVGFTPILTCDVWEHAYYLDYQNRRLDYVDIFLNHLINWDFAEANLN